MKKSEAVWEYERAERELSEHRRKMRILEEKLEILSNAEDAILDNMDKLWFKMTVNERVAFFQTSGQGDGPQLT